MGWNKEKLVFALSLLILLGSIVGAASSFVGKGTQVDTLTEPREAAVGIVGGDIALDWFSAGDGALRDPFRARSEWRVARPDPLMPPPFDRRARRIPLPAVVSDSPTAWPGTEEVKP